MEERRRLNVYGHCRHYDPQPGGVYNCLRGVDIRAHVGGPDYGWVARIPCLNRKLFDPPDAVPCELREVPTSEEMKADQAEADRIVTSMLSGKCADCGTEMVTVVDNEDVSFKRCPNCADVSVRSCKRPGASVGEVEI